MKNFKDTIVVAMGGSLLIPEKIDIDFLKKLKDMVKHFTEEGYQIALVIGGGKTARYYQSALREFDHVDNTDLDWVGIKSIHLNCELVKRAFSDLDVYQNIVLKPDDIKGVENSLIIIGAWEPGCSSDTDAVEIAHVIGANRIINFSNTSHVYSDDPHKNPNATRFDKLSWNEYRNLIPHEWTPGMPAPFDPIASKIAQDYNISVAVLGASVENLENYLLEKEFEGTIIS